MKNCIKCNFSIIVDDTNKHFYGGSRDSMCKDCLKTEKKTTNNLNYICCLGDLELVKHFISYGVKISNRTMETACINGHLDIVKFLYSLNNDISKRSLDASLHSVEILKFFKSCCIKFHSNLIKKAIAKSEIDTLEYFYDIGMKFTNYHITTAFLYSYIAKQKCKPDNVILFLHSKGLLKKAFKNKYIDEHILRILKKCNIPFQIKHLPLDDSTKMSHISLYSTLLPAISYFIEFD